MRPSDQLLGIASERGELLVARVRLALTSLLLLIPHANLFTFLTTPERVIGFTVTLTAFALSLVIYVPVRR